MKKIVFAVFVAIFTFSNVNAQKIELKKSFGENLFYQNGEKLTSNYNKKSKAAVELYNADLPTVSASFQPSFSLNFKGVNLGLTMSF